MVALYPKYICSVVATGTGGAEVTLIVPTSEVAKFNLGNHRKVDVYIGGKDGKAVHTMTMDWCECIASQPYGGELEGHTEIVLLTTRCFMYKAITLDRPMPKLTMWSQE
jgi:hypothetical protein